MKSKYYVGILKSRVGPSPAHPTGTVATYPRLSESALNFWKDSWNILEVKVFDSLQEAVQFKQAFNLMNDVRSI